MASASTSQDVKDLTQKTTQANKEHQYALKVYTERLEAELEAVDKLLTAADVSDHEDELEVDSGGTVIVKGSVRIDPPVTSSDLSAHDSPFYLDAMRRHRYLEATTVHPMKAQELEALGEAVRSENRRINALQAQFHGQQPFHADNEHSSEFLLQNKIGIDWERVAAKVSSSKSADVQRSAKECEIRWLGDRHPQFNHTQWTQPEIARVKELVADIPEGQVDWTDVAVKLGTGRTPIDCMRHAIARKTHSWNEEADQRLIAAVRVYGTDNWSLVARTVSEDATPTQCQSRYLRTIDPSIKRGSWTEEEDKLLRRAVSVFGHAWIEVAAFVPGRNNEQCRDRYNESLNPSVSKGKWTDEEDAALLQAVQKAGENKWKEISQLLDNGRTDNMCRSRYNALMKRKASTATCSPAPSESSASTRTGASSAAAGPSKRGARRAALASTEATPAPDVASPASEVPTPKPRPRPRQRKKPVAEVTNDEGGSSAAPTAVVDPPQEEAGEVAEVPIEKPSKRPGKRTKRPLAIEAPAFARQTKRRKTAAKPADSPMEEDMQNDAEVESNALVELARTAELIVNEDEAADHAEGEASSNAEVSREQAEGSTSKVASSRGRVKTRGKGKAAARKASARSTRTAPQPRPIEDELTNQATNTAGNDAAPPTKSGGRRGRKAALPSAQPTRRQPARGKAKVSSDAADEGDTGIVGSEPLAGGSKKGDQQPPLSDLSSPPHSSAE